MIHAPYMVERTVCVSGQLREFQKLVPMYMRKAVT